MTTVSKGRPLTRRGFWGALSRYIIGIRFLAAFTTEPFKDTNLEDFFLSLKDYDFVGFQ